MPDFWQAVRLGLHLRRKVIRTLVVLGALSIVLGVVEIGHAHPTLGTILILIGALLPIEVPVLVWTAVYRNRRILLQGSEVTLTDEGIERRTATTTTHVTWGMIERIHELGDMWIFDVNRLARIALTKQALTREQRAELAAFIAARTK